jgi:hypothetical protein
LFWLDSAEDGVFRVNLWYDFVDGDGTTMFSEDLYTLATWNAAGTVMHLGKAAGADDDGSSEDQWHTVIDQDITYTLTSRPESHPAHSKHFKHHRRSHR